MSATQPSGHGGKLRAAQTLDHRKVVVEVRTRRQAHCWWAYISIDHEGGEILAMLSVEEEIDEAMSNSILEGKAS